jgi:hypothetical protein
LLDTSDKRKNTRQAISYPPSYSNARAHALYIAAHAMPPATISATTSTPYRRRSSSRGLRFSAALAGSSPLASLKAPSWKRNASAKVNNGSTAIRTRCGAGEDKDRYNQEAKDDDARQYGGAVCKLNFCWTHRWKATGFKPFIPLNINPGFAKCAFFKFDPAPLTTVATTARRVGGGRHPPTQRLLRSHGGGGCTMCMNPVDP